MTTQLITHPMQIEVDFTAETGEIYLVCADNPALIPFLLANLALLGPTSLLTADSRLPVSELIRELRRRTLEIEATLARISLSRITRCFQIPDLVPTIPNDRPLVVANLLSIFRQEGIEMHDARRLLALLLEGIERLDSAVIIVVRPPTQPEDAILLEMLMAAATHHYEFIEADTQSRQQLGLFDPLWVETL